MANDNIGGYVSLREYFAAVTSMNDRANEQRFDSISTQLDDIADVLRDYSSRLRECERADSMNAERWSAHKEEHKRENGMQRIFIGVLATVESAIAAFIGILASRP